MRGIDCSLSVFLVALLVEVVVFGLLNFIEFMGEYCYNVIHNFEVSP